MSNGTEELKMTREELETELARLEAENAYLKTKNKSYDLKWRELYGTSDPQEICDKLFQDGTRIYRQMNEKPPLLSQKFQDILNSPY